jgi:hypothetical protein
MAKLESRMKGALSQRKYMPSALEVLVLQMFGMAGVLGAFGIYWFLM